MHIRLILLTLTLLACGLPTQLSNNPTAVPPESPTNTQETAPTDLASFLESTRYNAPSFQARTAESAPRPLLPTDNTVAPFIATGNGRQQTITAETPLQAQWRIQRTGSPFLLAVPNGTLDPVIEVYDNSGVLLISADESGTGGIESLDLSSIASNIDTIRIVIRPFEGTSGDVTLTPHDLAQLPPIIDVSEGVALGQTERYDFSLPASTAVWVQLTPEGTFDPVFELYSNTQFLRNIDFGTNGETETFIGLQSGITADYAITVFGFQGAEGRYRLTVIPLPCCEN